MLKQILFHYNQHVSMVKKNIDNKYLQGSVKRTKIK